MKTELTLSVPRRIKIFVIRVPLYPFGYMQVEDQLIQKYYTLEYRCIHLDTLKNYHICVINSIITDNCENIFSSIFFHRL